jgi:hypothetical protein
LKGSVELSRSLNRGSKKNYSNSSAGYKNLYAKICIVYYLPALAIMNARPYVYIKKKIERVTSTQTVLPHPRLASSTPPRVEELVDERGRRGT